MVDKLNKAELVRIAKSKGFSDAQISKMSYEELSALISNIEVKTSGTVYDGFDFLDPFSTKNQGYKGNIWDSRQELVQTDEAYLGFTRTPNNSDATQEVQQMQISTDEAENFSIALISQSIQSANELLLSQPKKEGVVSKGYDNIKEFLKTDLSGERVNKWVKNEKLGLMFLSQAKNKTLTKRQYFQQKKKILLEMIPGFDRLSDAQKQNIKSRIDSLNLEGVNEFLHKFSMLPGEDKPEYKQAVSAILAEFKSATESPIYEKNGIEGQKLKAKTQINKRNTEMDSDELIPFEDVFRYERGVGFSEKNIQVCEEKKAVLNYISGAKQNYEQLKSAKEEIEKSYADATKPIQAGENFIQQSEYNSKELEAKIFGCIKNYFNGDSDKAAGFLQNMCQKSKLDIQIQKDKEGNPSAVFGEEFKNDSQKNQALFQIMNHAVTTQEARYNKILDGKSYEKYHEDYTVAYINAYGTKNAEELAKAYSEDQENINANATGALQVAGLGAMLAGGVASALGLDPVGVPLAAAGGKLALGGMLTKTALDVINESTRKGGMSKQAAVAIIKETAINAGGFAVGMGAGAAGAKVAFNLLAKGSSKFASVVAEHGVDFVISSLGDLAMTGDINLEGNMMGVVTSTVMGLKTGKKVMKNFLSDPKKLRIETPKPTEPSFVTANGSGADFKFVNTDLIDDVLAQYPSETYMKEVFDKPNVQKQVGENLDGLLLNIEKKGNIANNKLQDVGYFEGYMTEDGTYFSLNYTKTKGKDKLLFIVDNQGNSKYLCGTSPENIAKINKIVEKMQKMKHFNRGLFDYYKIQAEIKATGKPASQVIDEMVAEADAKKRIIETPKPTEPSFRGQAGTETPNPNAPIIETPKPQGENPFARNIETPTPKIEPTKIEPIKVEIKALTADEFQTKKVELLAKAKEFEVLKNINENDLNEHNIFALEAIVNHPELMKNKNFADNVGDIITFGHSPEMIQSRIDMMEYISSRPELLNDAKYKNFADNVGDIITFGNSPEMIKSRIDMMEYISSRPELLNDAKYKNFAHRMLNVVATSNTPEQVKSRIDVMEFIKANPELMKNINFAEKVSDIISASNTVESASVAKYICDNPALMNHKNFADNVSDIIFNSKTPETAKASIDMMEFIKANPELMKNRNFSDKVGYIISNPTSAGMASVAKYICDNPALMNNKNFADKVGEIISSSDSAESAKARIDVMTHIFSKPEILEKYPNFADNVGIIISNSNSAESASVAKYICDNPALMNNKNFADKVWGIISYSYSAERASVAKCICEKPELMNNKNFAGRGFEIIAASSSAEIAQARIDVMNHIFSKPEMLEKYPNFADRVGDIIYNTSSAEIANARIDVMNHIFSKPEMLEKYPNFADRVGDIISNSFSAERAKARIDVMNHIFSKPEILEKYPNFADKVGDIIYNSDSAESAQARIYVMNHIFSKPEILEKYPNFADKVVDIIYNTSSAEIANARIDVMNHIFSKPEMLEKYPNFADKAGEIISSSDSAESAQARIYVMNHIFSKPEILEKYPNFADKVGEIIYKSYSVEMRNVAKYICDNPALMNNKNFADKAGEIISNSSSAESAKARIDVMDHIFSKPEILEKYPNFADKVVDIIYNSTSAERASVAKYICDKPEILQKYPNFADKVVDIISNSTSAERASVAKYICDKPELMNNKTFSDNVGNMLLFTDKGITVEHLVNYTKALDVAFAKKDQLRSGNNDISDAIITKKFKSNGANIAKAVDILGISTFTHNYPSKLDGVVELAEKVSSLKSKLSPESFEQLMLKINPENTSQYRSLAQKLDVVKAEIDKLKSPELKTINSQLNEVFTKIAELNQARQSAKGDKVALDNINEQMKTLNTRKMDLIKQLNEEKAKTPELGVKEKEAKAIQEELTALSKSVELDPQSIIDKTRVLSAIAEHNPADVQKFIDLMKSKTGDNEKIWNEEINKYVFEVMDMKFDPQLSNRLNLASSKYVGEILSGDSDFKEGFKEILTLLNENPNKSVKDILDDLPQNQQTRQMLGKIGVDYDKYVNADKNSFVKVEVTTEVEKAKQSAITSIENDFNDAAFKAMPKEHTQKILDALKELGIEFKEVEETIWVDDGIANGTKKVGRLYKNDKPIEFKDLDKALSAIKKAMQTDFWTTKTGDSTFDSYRETMYSHLTKDRGIQFDNANALKSDKTVALEIRKTDMNNVLHALFLGNHGSCCTAVGTGGNQYSAPTYIKNKMISAIEVVDGNNFVGNTMCYFAQVDGKPALILDNIELKSEYHMNDKLRDAMFDYAKQMCAEIGQPDMPIYAGPQRHKLNMEVLPKQEHEMQIVGNTGKDEIYLDFITDGRQVTGNEVDKVMLYKIR